MQADIFHKFLQKAFFYAREIDIFQYVQKTIFLTGGRKVANLGATTITTNLFPLVATITDFYSHLLRTQNELMEVILHRNSFSDAVKKCFLQSFSFFINWCMGRLLLLSDPFFAQSLDFQWRGVNKAVAMFGGKL